MGGEAAAAGLYFGEEGGEANFFVGDGSREDLSLIGEVWRTWAVAGELGEISRPFIGAGAGAG